MADIEKNVQSKATCDDVRELEKKIDDLEQCGGKNSRSYTNISQAYSKPSLMKSEILTYNG